MLPTALIPVRMSRTAKRRLAHVLSPGDRVRLVRELLDHVTSVALRAGLPVIVLSPTPVDMTAGVEVWIDEEAGLNRAVAAALRRAGTPTLVVHADLPLVGRDDMDRVLSCDADVVIARARDGGTNGLLLRRLIAPAFGPDSALEHAARARRAGLRAQVVDSPGFALDVDDEAGLRAVSAAGGRAYVPGRRP